MPRNNENERERVDNMACVTHLTRLTDVGIGYPPSNMVDDILIILFAIRWWWGPPETSMRLDVVFSEQHGEGAPTAKLHPSIFLRPASSRQVFCY